MLALIIALLVVILLLAIDDVRMRMEPDNNNPANVNGQRSANEQGARDNLINEVQPSFKGSTISFPTKRPPVGAPSPRPAPSDQVKTPQAPQQP